MNNKDCWRVTPSEPLFHFAYSHPSIESLLTLQSVQFNSCRLSVHKTPEHHTVSLLGKRKATGPKVDARQVNLSCTCYLCHLCGLLSNTWNPSLLVTSRFINTWRRNHLSLFGTSRFPQCNRALFSFSQPSMMQHARRVLCHLAPPESLRVRCLPQC